MTDRGRESKKLHRCNSVVDLVADRFSVDEVKHERNDKMLSEANEPFAYYASELGKRLNETSEQCLEICSLCRRAHDVLDRNEFDNLCDQLGISYPTATKWIKIDKSTRVRAYGSRLKLVGWSPLFEIVKLSEAEWQDLVKDKIEGAEGPVALTRTEIIAYRKSLPKSGDRFSQANGDGLESTHEAVETGQESGKPVRLITIERQPGIRTTSHDQEVLLEIVELLKKVESGRLLVTVSEELSSPRLRVVKSNGANASDARLH